mgnify:CR=1 FL=1
MVLNVLTGINKELDVISQKIYTDYNEAFAEMKKEHSVMIGLAREGGFDVKSDFVGLYGAELCYGDEPMHYKWYINSIEC